MKSISIRLPLQMLAIIAVSGLISCEKIIDISIPDKERKIVVNGTISAEKPVRINLSRSLSVLERDSLITISGADVKLFNGTDLMGSMQEDSSGYYSLPGFVPVVGQKYKLTASSGVLGPVEATAILPALVPISAVDTATFTNEWGQEEFRLTIKFNDPAGAHNYYGFAVDVTYKEFDYLTMTYTGKKLTHPSYIFSNDEGFLKDESTNYEGKLYFEDLLFNGMMKSVEFGISDYAFYESDTVWLDVKLEQTDPSFYSYILSLDAYQQAHGNPFSEPVQVFTNVTGGFGIFSGLSTSHFSIITQGMRKIK